MSTRGNLVLKAAKRVEPQVARRSSAADRGRRSSALATAASLSPRKSGGMRSSPAGSRAGASSATGHALGSPANGSMASARSSTLTGIVEAPFVDTCSRCHLEIPADMDVPMTGAGELFHPKCFTCSHCAKPIEDGRFYDFEGEIYCENSFD